MVTIREYELVTSQRDEARERIIELEEEIVELKRQLGLGQEQLWKSC